MKIKLSKTSILTEAEISADVQEYIKNGDFDAAYKKASSKVDSQNEKLFELRMTYQPNDKKKTDSAASLQPFTAKYLVMKDENGKPVSTRTKFSSNNIISNLLGKVFGFGAIDKDNFNKFFTTSENEEEAYVSTEDNIDKIIKQLEKGFGKDVTLTKLQARPGNVSNEKDEVINTFLKTNNIDAERIKSFRGSFIKDCETLGFEATRNPLIFWVQEFAQNINLTNDRYLIIHNLWADRVITTDDDLKKPDESIIYNKTLYNNTWVNIEWIVTAYKQAYSNLSQDTLLAKESTKDNPVAYKGTPVQFRNEAFFGKSDANVTVDVLRSRKEISEFSAKYISKEGIKSVNTEVSKKDKTKEVGGEEVEATNKPTKAPSTPKPVKDVERWKKVLQDTNNTNINKNDIEDFKRYLTSLSKKKI